MTAVQEHDSGIIEAVNGGHLHWQDFRENVLKPFRIRCSPTPRSERLPTTFLARLQASQRDLEKHRDQASAWPADVASGRGLTSTPLFPPNLIPRNEGLAIRRVMSPRLSREGLPVKALSPRNSLYELPTAKPCFVSGFNDDMFDKLEQTQLMGGLSVSGTVVDFARGEVMPSKTTCVPFLAFHKIDNSGEAVLEAARNACAISGSHFLRAQQQLFHKASGLQQLSDPAINFTCALSNDNAIINCHYVDDDGFYTMSPLCRFDLRQIEHFKSFQAWIDAIESWASLYLLSRVKGSIKQVLMSLPSPPPSPVPVTANSLSIDTNSNNVSAILDALRRQWPTIRWQNDSVGETPINSSIAQCGTPFVSRAPRNTSLGGMIGSTFASPVIERPLEVRSHSSISQRMAELPPLRTDIPLSAHPSSRQSLQHRRLSTATSLRSRSDGSTTPASPCRPPSLSPCTPGPEVPVSAKSPILVLQRRLDVAMNEIQDLRTQVEDLQGQLDGRTEVMERRLELILEWQEKNDCRFRATGGKSTSGNVVHHLERLVDQQYTSTPILRPVPVSIKEQPIPRSLAMPGSFDDADSDAAATTYFTRRLFIWCLAFAIRDERASLAFMALTVFILGIGGFLDGANLCQNTIAMVFSSRAAIRLCLSAARQTDVLLKAVQDCDLHAQNANEHQGQG